MKKLIPSILVFVFLAGISVSVMAQVEGQGTCDKISNGTVKVSRPACNVVGGTFTPDPVTPTNPTNSSGGSVSVSGKLTNPFITGGDLYQLAQMLIEQLVIPIGGIFVTLAFIYAGFMYVMAQGDPGKLKTAHNALLFSAIGAALLLGSWVISNVIQNTINQLKS
jgi:hypothetical protein